MTGGSGLGMCRASRNISRSFPAWSRFIVAGLMELHPRSRAFDLPIHAISSDLAYVETFFP